MRLPERPITPHSSWTVRADQAVVLKCRGKQGGVVREAKSVKCLVETQSPSLATDPCLLSEEQSWASQLLF